MQRTCTVIFCLGLVAACRGSATEPSALDDAGRRLLYNRADRTFDTAVLLKPASAMEERPGFDLAPLLLQEVEPGAPADSLRTRGDGIPVVYLHNTNAEIHGERHEQRTYLWGYEDEAASVQGVRVTLGRDGFPAIYEVLSDSSGARLIFVTETLEGAAAGEFGDPLEGRRFAIERAAAETPQVVVAGTLEPGPMPLGPFLYLTRDSRDIAAVICRCMESRVETVVDNIEYRLEPVDDLDPPGLEVPPWATRTSSPIELLRLPASGF